MLSKEEKITIVLVVASISALLIGTFAEQYFGREWENFKTQHQCRAISGKHTDFGKSNYVCDDDKTYLNKW